MISAQRINVESVKPYENISIRNIYEIDKARWISFPDAQRKDNVFMEFITDFKLESKSKFVIHVSADQRFELFCDDEYLGMGPDRSDLNRWSFHSYELELEAGKHRFRALIHSIKDIPQAQVTYRPGFILAAEASIGIDTGTAEWQVRTFHGFSTEKVENIKSFHVVGPNYIIDGNELFNSKNEFVKAEVIMPASMGSRTGCLGLGWRLFPSRLPEQIRGDVTGGSIRMVAEVADNELLKETPAQDNKLWQELVLSEKTLTIPANTRQTVIWDLEEYHCAYPRIVLSKGKGSSFKLEWAEGCYFPGEEKSEISGEKGNRNEIAGKLFIGYGDTFKNDGGDMRFYTVPWWRAGRYIRIMIETKDDPLEINSIKLEECRFPVENKGTFYCDDPELEKIIPIAVRGIQMCSHETYMDCPYYEQMMYVGDTRLQILTAFVMDREDRLNKRALELFDWSRHATGFILERHPSTPRQLSCTFSMIWILMLRDYAWWRDDPEFLKERLPGLRALLEQFKAHQADSDVLENLPGWSFIDWVTGWDHGCAADGEEGISSVNNLLFVLALNSAAEIEEAYGEMHLADYNRKWAAKNALAIKEKFWNEERGMFADNLTHTSWSEHAQCLALLSGLFDDKTNEQCFESLLNAEDLYETTVYFSFYLLETLNLFNRGDVIIDKMGFWKNLHHQGFKTPVEKPEPSRSDCHAWGSHPLFHMHASLAGIRPDAPGFKKVRITPKPGSLTRIKSILPHPQGEIQFKMSKSGEKWDFSINLPENIDGILVWKGQEYQLQKENNFKHDA